MLQGLESRKWSTSTLEEGLGCVRKQNIPVMVCASEQPELDPASVQARIQVGPENVYIMEPNLP